MVLDTWAGYKGILNRIASSLISCGIDACAALQLTYPNIPAVCVIGSVSGNMAAPPGVSGLGTTRHGSSNLPLPMEEI